MIDKFNQSVFTCLLLLSISGCTKNDTHNIPTNNEMINALIIGNAEHPDPVLERVRELEKQGILNNVIIRESFPVQIDITAAKNIIEELQEIPRKSLPKHY